jgi:hypothetical protein
MCGQTLANGRPESPARTAHDRDTVCEIK